MSLLFGGSALSECIKGDCKNGYGEFSWKGLGIYKGEFLKNKMHGYGEYEGYSDGSHAGLTHKGYYKNDKKHGDGKFTFPDGAIFEGEYRNNKMKIGKFTFPDGAIFEGEFSNDRMKLGRYVWPNGDICEEFNGSECLVNIIKKNNSLNSNSTDSNSAEKEKEKLKKQKAQEEKLKAKKKAEEEKLAAKQKAKEEEEKKRLLEEKIKQQKALDEKKLSLLPAKPKEEKAKKTLIDIQKFIKNNPNEFDILEISEFFIKTKPILENSFNDQLEKDLNSLIEYVKKSKNFQSYLREIEFKEREKNLKYIDEKLSLINKQIAKVTNFLYEKPNSIHAKNWLNSVKKAKQKLNNFNSFEEILSSSNELGTIIINKEILVKSNSESEKLIIELKGYLANNLTTDLTPKILEQIENIKKSVETENVNKINMANEKARNFINKIFLEPKKKAQKKKEKENEKLKKKKAEKEKPKAKKKKLFDSVINAKWGLKGIPCDINGGTYFMHVHRRGFMFWVGGKIQDYAGAPIESEINQISETEFVVTTMIYSTPKTKIVYGAIGDRMTAKTVKTYKIVNEDLLRVRSEIKMIDLDAILAGKKGYQVGYTYKTENSERVRCK